MTAPASMLYAAAPGRHLALAQGAGLFQPAAGIGLRALTPAERAAMAVCERFAAGEEHVASLARDLRIPAPQAQALFAHLRGAGLLISLEDVLAAAPAPRVAEAAEPLLVVRSFERPAGLERLLGSLRAEQHRHDRSHRLIVVDDSPRAEAAAITRAIVEAHARASGAPVALLDESNRDHFLDALLRGFDEDERSIALRLLCPHHPSAVTGSRSWNWAVLLGAGGFLSILDDDVCFPLRRPPADDRRIDVGGSFFATTRFFDEADGHLGLAPLQREAYDYLADFVGRPAAALIAERGVDPASATGRSAADIAGIAGDRTVIAATPGLYGALAYDSSAYLVCADPATRQDLWRPPYRPGRLDGDRIWHGYPRPRLTALANYTPLLLDARALLPFAGTWGRVDDTFFLMLLRAMVPQPVYAHVDVLLGHFDERPRGRRERARQGLLLDPNTVVAQLVAARMQSCSGADRAARLALAGQLAADYAASPEAGLAAEIRWFRAPLHVQLVQQLEAVLARHPEAPAGWREDAQAIVAANRKELLDPEPPSADVAATRAGFAQLASAAPLWPRLWARGADLRAALYDRARVA